MWPHFPIASPPLPALAALALKCAAGRRRACGTGELACRRVLGGGAGLAVAPPAGFLPPVVSPGPPHPQPPPPSTPLLLCRHPPHPTHTQTPTHPPRRYGKQFDRSSVCYNTVQSLLIRVVDSCPCYYPGGEALNAQHCCHTAAGRAEGRDARPAPAAPCSSLCLSTHPSQPSYRPLFRQLLLQQALVLRWVLLEGGGGGRGCSRAGGLARHSTRAIVFSAGSPNSCASLLHRSFRRRRPHGHEVCWEANSDCRSKAHRQHVSAPACAGSCTAGVRRDGSESAQGAAFACVAQPSIHPPLRPPRCSVWAFEKLADKKWGVIGIQVRCWVVCRGGRHGGGSGA